MVTKHWWRTRPTPLPTPGRWWKAGLQSSQTRRQGTTDSVNELLPDLYPTGAQLRTLQRRVKAWRAERAQQLRFGAIGGPISDPEEDDDYQKALE